MCTLLIAHRRWADCPLLVAANRDERLARPATPPALRAAVGGPVLAPTDLAAGGTWMGANATGLFAGITNRFGASPDPRRSSRGEVVMEALRTEAPEQAVAHVLGLGAERYNPFHLLVANTQQALVMVSDGATFRVEALEAGWHVITERSYEAGPTMRPTRLTGEVERWGPSLPDDVVLEKLLAQHAHPTIEGVCVHWDARGYGTRSSAIVRFDGQGDLSAWRYTEGAPCVSDWQELSADALVFRE
jgi:uncharacterized protein with NRDE domain